MVQTESARSAGVTADGMAAVAVSLVNGCAMQAMVDPAHFEVEQYLAAVEGILGWVRWADGQGPAAVAAGHGRTRALSAPGGHL
jgi:hypothetical protein